MNKNKLEQLRQKILKKLRQPQLNSEFIGSYEKSAFNYIYKKILKMKKNYNKNLKSNSYEKSYGCTKR